MPAKLLIRTKYMHYMLYILGLAAVAKMIVAMEEKVMPANLHYDSPNPDIPGLVNGQLHVVNSNTAWEGGIVGVNSFGFGGSNVHTILKSNQKQSEKCEGCDKARLVVYSARTQEGVEDILNIVQKNPENVHLHKLLNETANMPVGSHPYRGFTVLNSSQKNTDIKVQNPKLQNEIPYSTSLLHCSLMFFKITGKTCGKKCIYLLKVHFKKDQLLKYLFDDVYAIFF